MLKKSQTQLRQFLDNSKDSVLIYTCEKRQLVYSNEKASQMFKSNSLKAASSDEAIIN
jgi:hypothetical protein